ncbi:MAG: hypothetical protein LBT97_07045 [Planctomycetota bacterium]|jgi:hypothetical protein|nr:hypothetical protein [Planctomycetota bacterium]
MLLRGKILAATVLLSIASGSYGGFSAEPASNSAGSGDPSERFNFLAYATPGLWDGEKINQLTRAMPGLPAEAACSILWLCASISPRVDDLSIYAAALQSQSPVVKRHAAAIMLAKGGSDHKRLLMGIVSGSDIDLAGYVLDGLAQRHVTAAAPELIQVLFHPHASDAVTESAAQHLRRMTGANLPADPLAWRQWWEDNRHLFE